MVVGDRLVGPLEAVTGSGWADPIAGHCPVEPAENPEDYLADLGADPVVGTGPSGPDPAVANPPAGIVAGSPAEIIKYRL